MKKEHENNFKFFVNHLRFEALALAALMLALTWSAGTPLWVPFAAFLFFDIGMIGYMFNANIGAAIYNVSHNSTLPTLLVTYGVLTDANFISILGFSWTFHIAVDRVLGYGLKHSHSFHNTHLGFIGKPNK